MKVAALIPVSLRAASADSEPGYGDKNSLVLSELAGEPLLGRVCARLAQVARLYRLLGVKAPELLQRPDVRFDVESAADIVRFESLLRHFAGRIDFSLEEMLGVLDAHPGEIFRNML